MRVHGTIGTIMNARTKRETIHYFAKNLGTAVGIVLIWRGVWVLLDYFDIILFGGNHLISGLFGVVVGVAILYIPDKDLKELEKL